MSVAATLYRSLLRLGRQLDREPLGKALLLARATSFFDRSNAQVRKLDSGVSPTEQAAALLEEHICRGEFYVPDRSVCEALKQQKLNLPQEYGIDIGLALLRTFSVASAASTALEPYKHDALTSSKRVRALGCELRQTTVVRPGCLLITHPIACLTQPALHHAVILIVDVSNDGVTGVVINKPMPPTVGEALHEDAAAMIGPLGDIRLHEGGDVHGQSLLLLHNISGLSEPPGTTKGKGSTKGEGSAKGRGSTQIGEDLWYTADLAEVAVAVAATDGGVLDSDGRPRVKCVAGCAGWATSQLQAELDRNVWFLAEPTSGIGPLALLGQDETLPGECLRDVMWSGALYQLGDMHEKIAAFPGSRELVWNQMAEVWTRQVHDIEKRVSELRKLDEPPRV